MTIKLKYIQEVYMNLINTIYDTASAAFIQVGTFVAVTLFLFGFINYRFNGKLVEKLEDSKKIQVVVGAVLGLTPGCGGAIMIVPLYLLGKVSFGTLVATFIATMGDASFILLTQAPDIFVYVSLISFVVAIASGYTIDYFGIGKRLVGHPEDKVEAVHTKYEDIPTEFELNEDNSKLNFHHIGHLEGDFIDIALHHEHDHKGFLHHFRHSIGYRLFWFFALFAFPLGIMNLMMVDIDSALPVKNLSLIGFLGTAVSIIYTIISKKIVADDNHAETESKMNSLKETIIHNAEETAFVVTWVFVALLVYEIGLHLMGGEAVLENFVKGNGYIAVLIAVLIGLIPGCGPQIVLATLFVQGTIPFSALIANAICNDGDALFPVIAIDRKSAFQVTVYNLIPALLVGTAFYLFGL